MKQIIKIVLIPALIVSLLMALSPAPKASQKDLVDFVLEYLSIKYSGYDLNEVLYVAAGRQKLYHIKDGLLLSEYSVSTAINGVGTTANSKRTPTGLHRIKEKIGSGVPSGGIFENRVFKHDVLSLNNAPPTKDDLITSRIIWLQGLEPGHNSGPGHDSYERCIYIHGTHQEELIGTPASHGCIRMRNADVIELFEKVREGTYVVILNN